MIRQDPFVLNQEGRGWIPCAVERALGDILRKEDGKNATHLLCFGWIDVKDPRMGIRASKDGTIDHARQIEVVGIPRLTRDLGEGFMTWN